MQARTVTTVKVPSQNYDGYLFRFAKAEKNRQDIS